MNRASSATGWVRNPDGTLGWTWNPITGCLNGCEYCYARKLANGRLKAKYLANLDTAPTDSPDYQPLIAYNTWKDPFYPRFWEERLGENFGVYNKGIFVCDMSDLFGIGIPKEWTRAVLHKMTAVNYYQHRFYLLTKQPQNLIKFSPFPDNCWVGVTATNQQQFDNAVKYLREVKATVKYISFEPLLERIKVE